MGGVDSPSHWMSGFPELFFAKFRGLSKHPLNQGVWVMRVCPEVATEFETQFPTPQMHEALASSSVIKEAGSQ